MSTASNSWEKQVFDLGRIESNKPATGTFVYTGEKKIGKPQASCGCTVTRAEGNKINFTFKKRLNAKRTSQNISKRITVPIVDEFGKTIETHYLTIKAELIHANN